VAKSVIELAVAREADQAAHPLGCGSRLAQPAGAAVAPDHPVGMTPVVQELERVRERSRRQLDFVPVALE
jgi:hypothetical protein